MNKYYSFVINSQFVFSAASFFLCLGYKRNAMEIQKADSTHARIIAEFQIAMAWESEKFLLDRDTILNGVLAVFEDKNKGRYYVATDAGKVVASLLITYEWSDWRNSWVWWIQSVYVLPEYRRKGVFSAMYKFIKKKVELDNSVAGIRLYVDKANKKAISTYKKLGMTDEHYDFFEWMKS